MTVTWSNFELSRTIGISSGPIKYVLLCEVEKVRSMSKIVFKELSVFSCDRYISLC